MNEETVPLEVLDDDAKAESLMETYIRLTADKKETERVLKLVRAELLEVRPAGTVYRTPAAKLTMTSTYTRYVDMRVMAATLTEDLYTEVTDKKVNLKALDRAFGQGRITSKDVEAFVTFNEQTSIRVTELKQDEGENA